MKNPPRNIKAARRKRYGKVSWNPTGHSYIAECCAFEVTNKSGYQYQCSRKNGHGVGDLYCRQHAKIAQREIDEVKP